jgi:hypothetical protein
MRTPATVLMVPLMLACDSPTLEDGEFAVADSAGIAVLTSRVDRLPTWTVDLKAIVALGGEADDIELFHVTSARFHASGGYVVANAGGPEVLRFGPAGDLLARFGRRGEGPGEFEWVQNVYVLPDGSILAYDDHVGRATFFEENGDFRGTIDLRLPPGMPVSEVFLAQNGFMVGVRAGPEPVVEADFVDGLVTSVAVHVLFDPVGEPLDTIVSAPGDELFLLRSRSGGPGGFRVPLFGLTDATAVDGDRVYTRIGRGRAIGRYTLEGRLEAVLIWNGPDLSLDEGVMGKAALAYFSDPSSARRYDLPIPDAAPGFGQILVDDQGRLWVSSYVQYLRDPDSWLVFSREGRALANVAVPARFAILAVRGDQLIGRLKDDLDVEHVGVFKLLR